MKFMFFFCSLLISPQLFVFGTNQTCFEAPQHRNLSPQPDEEDKHVFSGLWFMKPNKSDFMEPIQFIAELFFRRWYLWECLLLKSLEIVRVQGNQSLQLGRLCRRMWELQIEKLQEISPADITHKQTSSMRANLELQILKMNIFPSARREIEFLDSNGKLKAPCEKSFIANCIY